MTCPTTVGRCVATCYLMWSVQQTNIRTIKHLNYTTLYELLQPKTTYSTESAAQALHGVVHPQLSVKVLFSDIWTRLRVSCYGRHRKYHVTGIILVTLCLVGYCTYKTSGYSPSKWLKSLEEISRIGALHEPCCSTEDMFGPIFIFADGASQL